VSMPKRTANILALQFLLIGLTMQHMTPGGIESPLPELSGSPFCSKLGVILYLLLFFVFHLIYPFPIARSYMPKRHVSISASSPETPSYEVRSFHNHHTSKNQYRQDGVGNSLESATCL